MAQFKAGFSIQVDVQDEAKGIFEIVMGQHGVGRFEQH
jgi:hypothetical protein